MRLVIKLSPTQTPIEMKSKIATGLLVLVCIILGIVLSQTKEEAQKQQQSASSQIKDLETTRTRVENKLGEQEAVNTRLTNEVLLARDQIKGLEGNLMKSQADLQAAQQAAQQASQVAAARIAKLEKDLQGARNETGMVRDEKAALAQKSQQEIAVRDNRINQLSANNDELTNKINGLNSSIQGLEKSIAETERKLAAAEGDREFLLKELKRLQAEKAELEQRMKDLAFLREQVRQLKEELNISRRLDWIRRGIYGDGELKKGSQLLMEGLPKPKPAATNYNLEVEITRDGAVKVAPGTNAPPTKPK